MAAIIFGIYYAAWDFYHYKGIIAAICALFSGAFFAIAAFFGFDREQPIIVGLGALAMALMIISGAATFEHSPAVDPDRSVAASLQWRASTQLTWVPTASA